MNYVGQLYGRIGRKYFPLGITSEQVDAQTDTIKGLDRRTREYQDECKRLQERIYSLLEADAGRPVRDTNGTIEAQRNLIAKLKGDVLKLQAKVQEQDEKMSQWANDLALQTR